MKRLDTSLTLNLAFLAVHSIALADGILPKEMEARILAAKGSQAKSILCDGKKAKIAPKAIVNFKYPKFPAGTPIDKAAEIKKERLNLVREFLKRGYFTQFFFTDTWQERDAYWDSMGHYPIDPVADYLMRNYTFRFPLSVVQKVFKKSSPQDYQGFGYDYNDLTWRASKAIEDADWMWRNYTYRMTTVNEVPKSDGTVNFEVMLSLQLFCEVGIANSELVTE